ncbi:MAG: hypothetical protein LYZ69_09260 [Nitrososphaerales archaeon]|nr:hypothetical protein [Nitrososphaerales archaeon]
MGAVKVHAAKAYALLEVLGNRLSGLKAMEAKAALNFFPRSGSVRGRHTTDEFLVPVWREYAHEALKAWNSKRRVKLGETQIGEWAASWLEGRIKRARRFIDRADAQQ